MPDSQLVNALLAYGPLGIFAVLLAIGWLIPRPAHDKVVGKLEAELAMLREALEHERLANNEMRGAGAVTNQLIGALVTLSGRPDPVEIPVPDRQRSRLHLDAEELGLGH